MWVGVDSLVGGAFSAGFGAYGAFGFIGGMLGLFGAARAIPGQDSRPGHLGALAEADGLLLARVRGWSSGDNGGLRGKARGRATAMPIPEVGRPGTGKSFLLQAQAITGWELPVVCDRLLRS